MTWMHHLPNAVNVWTHDVCFCWQLGKNWHIIWIMYNALKHTTYSPNQICNSEQHFRHDNPINKPRDLFVLEQYFPSGASPFHVLNQRETFTPAFIYKSYIRNVRACREKMKLPNLKVKWIPNGRRKLAFGPIPRDGGKILHSFPEICITKAVTNCFRWLWDRTVSGQLITLRNYIYEFTWRFHNEPESRSRCKLKAN